jgi:mRNA-degrading endonuclease RelE of RelBE toxin-antitoxin system
MKVEVKKRVSKDTEKLPIHVQLLAAEEIKKLKAANNLSELDNIRQMEGTNEPYYRLKFNDYRYLLYYDETTNSVSVRRLKHRKDAYKKHNLPWL